MKYLTKCPICKSSNITTLHRGLSDNRYKTSQEKFDLQHCTDCGIVFTNPQIEFAEFSKFYPPDAYVPYLNHSIKKYQFLSKFLYDGFTKLFIDKFRGVIMSGGKLLEVGCSNGGFLLKCQKRGMKVTGVEPESKAARTAANRGLDIIPLPIEQAYHRLKDQRFDVIFMSHVFEHIQQPRKVLRLLKRLLTDSGKIIMLIPNIDSVIYKFFKDNWMLLDIPRHFFHYSPKNINYLIQNSGLHIEKVRFVSGPISVLNSIRYRLNIKKFQVHDKYLVKTMTLPLVIFLNAIRKSDEVAIFIRKASCRN